jgi:S-adenosylmethionine/arginine decarboxylase-like enzyme
MTTPDKKHKHLIVRAEISAPPSADDCAEVCRWFSRLVSTIRMKELAPPRAFYWDEVGNRGLTADVLLTTSNAVLHIWDECVPAVAQIDVYSCADFTPEEVIGCLEVFGPSKVEFKFLDRDGGLTVVQESVPILYQR